ncbi:odorant receptor 9a-like [Bombus bifarius]|uniref:Odorant receptor n=1 Tax=Bombus bifarius TaxID=103933 RepID=A0A6P8NHW2_9HYME|nr:odorant receptor 9a-like [Bombus bifarius]
MDVIQFSKYVVFQKTGEQYPNIYDIPYYNMIKKYLRFLGLDPHQKNGLIIVIIMVTSMTSVLIPMSIVLYGSLYTKNLDMVLECLPHLGALLTSFVKVLNVHLNRENFRKLFDSITKEWQQLKLSQDLYILEEVTIRGSKMAKLYRNTLLICMVLFLLIPLISPILDIVLPLNETRPRQQLVNVNYVLFDSDNYFFYVYLQLSWASVVVSISIVTVDSLLMLIVHHNSGLFIVCGHQIQKNTRNLNSFTNEVMSERYTYKQIRNCVIMHNKAIEFYDILDENNRISYMIQTGLNMIGITTTAVQTVINLDRPGESIKSAVLCGANQFHLFMLSLPGQILVDHCTELTKQLYDSIWYGAPVGVQKMLYMMQIRTRRPCTLTACGLYQMNIENFGTTFKTCMSYITMIMSLKE